MPALTAKLLGGLAYCFIYQFYYGGAGDTFSYFLYGTMLSDWCWLDWEYAWTLFNLSSTEFSLNTFEVTEQMTYFNSDSTWLIVRLTGVLNLFSFNNFYVTALFFSFLSFTGLWVLYRVFIDLYPRLEWSMFLAIFLVPSTLFWGSGIMKDTITIGGIGWMTYGFYYGFINYKRIVSSLLVFVIATYITYTVKFYIAIAALPMFFYWYALDNRKKITDWRFSFLLFILFACFMASVYWFLGNTIYHYIEVGAMAFAHKALGFQWWHAYLGETGGSASVYTLGEVEYSVMGVLSKFLPSINVTLFRPYLFEVKNAIMLVTSLESTLFLLFTLWVLLRVGILRTFSFLLKNHVLTSFLIFVALFAFITGFTSYNFGALARYKIPCLPFYVAILFILLEEKRVKI